MPLKAIFTSSTSIRLENAEGSKGDSRPGLADEQEVRRGNSVTLTTHAVWQGLSEPLLGGHDLTVNPGRERGRAATLQDCR